MALKNNQKPKKSLILLKSSVIGFGIVFVVLFMLLIIVKIKKDQNLQKSDTHKQVLCKETSEVQINNSVEQIINSKNEIIILTKPKNGFQELLVFDEKCDLVKNKIKLIIK